MFDVGKKFFQHGVMQSVRIRGARSLSGAVEIGGSKNAALPILAASILTGEQISLKLLPQLDDISLMLSILKKLGGEVSIGGGCAAIKMESVGTEPDGDAVRRMRASICLLGPMLARRGEAILALPGGCVIGPRPIDLHLKGFQKLGCEVEPVNGKIRIRAKRLVGNRIYLGGRHGSTVTGTANILCAATLAKGMTEIHFAACEPEIVDLCNFLVKMGAKIGGIGSPTLAVEGVDVLHGAEHELTVDRIQAGTFALLAPMVRGDIAIAPVTISHCAALLDVLEQMGVPVDVGDRSIVVRGGDCQIGPANVSTMAYPGFPTDLQAALCALVTQANGVSTISEGIYCQRFAHVGELARMGAKIRLDGGGVTVEGPAKLSGAELSAVDLRGGACLYMAALAANGESTIANVRHVDRGYEHFEEKLRSLGADVERF
jgi:UDP-N-acetylglucosamine 1-carboxyvinyltransferase